MNRLLILGGFLLLFHLAEAKVNTKELEGVKTEFVKFLISVQKHKWIAPLARASKLLIETEFAVYKKKYQEGEIKDSDIESLSGWPQLVKLHDQLVKLEKSKDKDDVNKTLAIAKKIFEVLILIVPQLDKFEN